MTDAQTTQILTVGARLRLGWVWLKPLLRVKTHREAGSTNDNAQIQLQPDKLLTPGVSYLGEAAVEANDGSQWHRLFTGLVDKVDVHDAEVQVTLAGNQREIQDVRMGGLVIGPGNDAREIIQGILRSAGWPAERMDLQGWQSGLSEPFLVARTVEGAELSDVFSFGDVSLSNINPCSMDFGTTHDLITEFSNASAWISTSVVADTLFDAELLGRARLDLGISLVRALGAYSYPAIGGELRSFDRNQSRATITMGDGVFVGSTTSPRKWLRSVRNLTPRETLRLNEIIPRRFELRVRIEESPLLARAFREWRAAIDSSDDFDRLSHLWRSVECYSARSRPRRLFSKTEIHHIRKHVLALESTSEQRERLEEVWQMLNSPPLLVRFQEALTSDGVNLEQEEFDAIAATRPLRNALEHGQTLTDPQHRALDIALGIMNFVLVSTALSVPES